VTSNVDATDVPVRRIRKAGHLGQILNLPTTNGSVYLGDLAADLGDSEATVRRDETEAAVNRALIDRIQRVIAVAGASKLGRVVLANICRLDLVEQLITDANAEPAEVHFLRSAGVTVTVV
jgi:DeoR/GlpR family transcriptional regulator of sugar metabolism